VRTYAEERSLALDILIDAGIEPGGTANQLFANAELDAWMPDCVAEYSNYRPREVKDTSLVATASTWDVTLTQEILRNLIRIVTLEYDPKTGQDPTLFRRGFNRFGNTIRLKLDYAPAGGEAINLYLHKKHLLVNVGTTDLAGAVKTLAAAGASSLALKSLGTGVINEDTQLTITGDSTVYTVTAKATINTNEAIVYITPTLSAQALVDTVVTLVEPASTLDIVGEGLLANLIAARAAINKSRLYIGSVTVGNGRSASDMLTWGRDHWSDTMSQIKANAIHLKNYDYPTGV
jgi:hypothetical protein